MRIQEALTKKNAISDMNRKIKEMKRKRRIRERANTDVDFIAKNVNQTEMVAFHEHQYQLMQLRQVREQR